MDRKLKLRFISPPFAGHLHPQLDLARRLRDAGFEKIQFLSTPEACTAVELSGFDFVPLLRDVSHVVFEISNTQHRVGSNPIQLWQQLQKNLSLMDQLRRELQSHWTDDRPDLVIADFTLPVAGWLARQMGFRWWTSMPSPCALETPDGIPTYLGGWLPRPSVYGRVRDALGRSVIRSFKLGVYCLLRQQFKKLGLASLYRRDGYEAIYSDDTILMLGLEELEFAARWPAASLFVGPMTRSPPFRHSELQFDQSREHILVTLGTHVRWAKESAIELIRDVAKKMPEFVFHFSRGEANSHACEINQNLHIYDYIPYDENAKRYVASINHGGTGAMYSCLKSGLPLLVWPHDFDQFDHAARIEFRGLGLWLRHKKVDQMVSSILRLRNDSQIRSNLKRFQQLIADKDPVRMIMQRLEVDRGDASASN